MRPKPRTPSVLPYSSAPLKRERSQAPPASEPWACGMLRHSASITATVCSAAAIEFASGALATTIPRLVAASMSTLSTPVPARPITRSLSPFSIRPASSWVAERIRIPSNSGMRRSSSASSQSSPSSTSKRSRSSSTPASAIRSLTRTFNRSAI